VVCDITDVGAAAIATNETITAPRVCETCMIVTSRRCGG
jgi:hypothetical protein